MVFVMELLQILQARTLPMILALVCFDSLLSSVLFFFPLRSMTLLSFFLFLFSSHSLPLLFSLFSFPSVPPLPFPLLLLLLLHFYFFPSCICLGRHEPVDWYTQCKTRERNKGLFTADQNVQDDIGNTLPLRRKKKKKKKLRN